MGRAKELFLQQEEQGWSFSPDVRICDRCLSDPELVAFVRVQATEFTCDFCNRAARKLPCSIPFDDLMEVLGETFGLYYDRAVNVMGWDGEDQRYFGTTYDTADIVRYAWDTISENEQVMDAIIEAFDDDVWCDRNPYSTTGFEAYEFGWEQFCNAVKHKTRYFFSTRKKQDDDDYDHDITPVSATLQELTGMFEEYDLIKAMDTSSVFWRSRVHGPDERCQDWKSLGPPPPTLAPSNRMSPAGISMFYGSTNVKTATAEAIASLRPGKTVRLTTASWSPTRALHLLDLTAITPTPNFWFSARYERDRIRFLHAFTKSIVQPVIHDGREHIEYVPPQILTEYVRHEYRTSNEKQLDGIMYPSAQVSKGKNIVLFTGPEDLTPAAEREFNNDEPILTLNTNSIRRHRKIPT